MGQKLTPSANPEPVSDPQLLLAAGRRDRQVLGLEHLWAAWDRRHLRPGRRSQRSLPTELHHCVSRAGPACADSCSCTPRAEMGTNLPSVDLGPGRTAVVVSAGSKHTCALLVSLPRGTLGGGNLQNRAIRPDTQRDTRCRTSATTPGAPHCWTPVKPELCLASH